MKIKVTSITTVPDELRDIVMESKDRLMQQFLDALPEGTEVEVEFLDEADVPCNDNVPVPVKPAGASVPSVKKAA